MDIRFKGSALLVVLVMLVPGAAANDGVGSAAYKEDVEAWRAGRLERLRRPRGYLALTGLYWLQAGDNSFGSDPASDMVFRSREAPARIGVFHLENGEVRVEVHQGVKVLNDGKPVRVLKLHHDADPEHDRTELTLGTMTWYAIKRGDKFGIRLEDTASEVRRNFKGIESFSIDERWRISGKFEAYQPLKYIAIASVGDIHTRQISTGAVVFEIDGKTHRLDTLVEFGVEELFIIFTDQTSGLETYGAGRSLYVALPAEDGSVVIDFNKAYNQPCAFSDFTTCWLPPPQNHLDLRVIAGEKTYKQHKP